MPSETERRKMFHSAKTEGNLGGTDVDPETESVSFLQILAKNDIIIAIGVGVVALAVMTAKWAMIKFVVIAVLLFEMSYIIGGVIDTGLVKTGLVDATLAGFIERVTRLVSPMVIVYCVLRCLDIISDETSPQIVAALSIAIGLATQSVMSNFASAAMLVTFRPFQVGDVVSVGGNFVTIARIGVMFTHADDFNNHRVLVPNSKMLDAQAITNWSHNKTHLYKLPVRIPTGKHTCVEIREVLEKAATAVDLAMPTLLEKHQLKDSLDRPKTVVRGPLEFTSEGMTWMLALHCPSTMYGEAEQFGNSYIHDCLFKAGIPIFELNSRKGCEDAS